MQLSTLSFLTRGDEIYLSGKRRGFGKGYLNGYGGKVATNEVVEDAAIRELREEAGLTVSAQNLERVGIIDFFEGNKHLFECHLFFVTGWRGEPKESEEMAEPSRYNRNTMPYDNMWGGDRVWLPLIFGGKKIRAKAYYKEGMGELAHFEYEALA